MVLQLAGDGPGLLKVEQNGVRALIEGQAGLGKGQFAGRAMEQGGADPALKLIDAPRDRRGGLAGLPASLRERTRLVGLNEQRNRTQSVHRHPFHSIFAFNTKKNFILMIK